MSLLIIMKIHDVLSYGRIFEGINTDMEKSRYTKYVFKYKWLQLTAFLCLILSAVIAYFLPYATMKIIDGLALKFSIKTVVFYAVIYLLAALFNRIFILFSNYIFLRVSRRIVTEIKQDLCRRVVLFDGSYFVSARSGELYTVIESDVEKVQSMFGKTIPNFLAEIFTSIPIIIFVLNIEPNICFVFAVLLPLIILNQRHYMKKINSSYKECRDNISLENSVIQEFLTQIMDIVSLNAESFFIKKIVKKLGTVESNYVHYGLICYLRSFSIQIFSLFAFVVILCIGGIGVIEATITVGGLIAIVENYQKIMTPFVRASDFWASYQECCVSLSRMNNLLNAKKDEGDERGHEVKQLSAIAFQNVSFFYEEGKYVLNNVSLKFEYGKVTALVGESGGGKTTIGNLLLCLWQPQEGNIYLDNKRITDFSVKAVREKISIVSQNVVLFDDTIWNNICLQNTSISKDEVWDMCKMCGIYEFIKGLPEGLETMVGERGIKLSGGQKQRIEIVRALLKNTPVILFDEATSALDNKTENIIQNAINKIKDTHIVIVIAHRLSTIQNADKIYVIQDGMIIEEGKHEQLIEKKGKYASLYHREL